ncbi:MAG: hypothetical protein NUV97_00605 [archaeon]|nr:hypothetical protein [archaeon]
MEELMFNTIKLVRGFTEIQALWEFTKKHKLWICGGYARYCASLKVDPVPARDIDLFCENESCYPLAYNELIDSGLEIEYENDLSVTFKIPKDKNHLWRTTPTMQIIKPVKESRIVSFGIPEVILENFDFTITRACIVSPTEVLVDEHFIEDDLRNLIIIKNIHCPVSSMFRAIKYIRKGFFMSPVESIKLFQDWSSRSDEYRAQLLDYLMKIDIHKESGESTLSQKEIDELERLMMLD